MVELSATAFDYLSRFNQGYVRPNLVQLITLNVSSYFFVEDGFHSVFGHLFFIQIKLVKVACNDDFWVLFFTKDSIKNPAKVVHYVWSVFLGSAGYVDWYCVNRYPLEVSKGPDNVIAECLY